MTNTAELKIKFEQVEKDLRDRPARILLWIGGIGLTLSGLAIAWLISESHNNPQMVSLRESTNPAMMTVALLCGLVLMSGYLLRYLLRTVHGMRGDLASDCEKFMGGLDAAHIQRHEQVGSVLADLWTTVEQRTETQEKALSSLSRRTDAGLAKLMASAARLTERHQALERTLGDQAIAAGRAATLAEAELTETRAALAEVRAEAKLMLAIATRSADETREALDLMKAHDEAVRAALRAEMDSMIRQARADTAAELSVAFDQLHERLSAESNANAKVYSDGLTLLNAEIQALKDLQGDLERDLAALIISRQPDVHADDGVGGSVISFRQMRPEGSG